MSAAGLLAFVALVFVCVLAILHATRELEREHREANTLPWWGGAPRSRSGRWAYNIARVSALVLVALMLGHFLFNW